MEQVGLARSTIIREKFNVPTVVKFSYLIKVNHQNFTVRNYVRNVRQKLQITLKTLKKGALKNK